MKAPKDLVSLYAAVNRANAKGRIVTVYLTEKLDSLIAYAVLILTSDLV
jgi:hypothetical protein